MEYLVESEGYPYMGNKFIDDLCYVDNYLNIKELINFDKKKKKFKVVLVVSCRIKK